LQFDVDWGDLALFCNLMWLSDDLGPFAI